jgi:hypothetical protein
MSLLPPTKIDKTIPDDEQTNLPDWQKRAEFKDREIAEWERKHGGRLPWYAKYMALLGLLLVGLLLLPITFLIRFVVIPFIPLGPEINTLLTCQHIEPSLPVVCEQEYYPCSQGPGCRETQIRGFELRKAIVASSKINLGTDKGRIPLIDCGTLSADCLQLRNVINNFVENPEEDASYVWGESKLTIEDGRLTYLSTSREDAVDIPETTTSVNCQRSDQGLPVTCERAYFTCSESGVCGDLQVRSYELHGVQLRGDPLRILLETDQGNIDLADCGEGSTWDECKQVKDAINNFVDNPEETASYTLGDSKLTIEDGRLTYEP